MKAIKANKQYTISESEKASYLAQGFDIRSDDGKLIEQSPSSTVSRRDYDELLDKYNKVVSENKKLKDKVKGNVPES